ncbi:MAG TPA: DUF1858 domain-containing protein [Pirellulales bacterium]|nr:DUF1858 domain-containing protein [Pirellulales bacterium]
MTTAYLPDAGTLIPELLRARPQARAVLDRYGLRGCGGPEGPAETLGFFARAHEVPLDRLCREIEEASHRSAPSALSPPKPALEDTLYRPFFRAGIAVVLTLGAAWGAYLLARIALAGSFTAAGVQAVNAHGHAQIFGWVGLFVMGFAYQAFPRFKHTSLAHPRWAFATLWLLLAGLVGRSVGQVLAADHAWIWWLTVAASACEVAAVAIFAWLIVVTWRRSGKPLAFYEYYILSALGWFFAQTIYESVYLTVTSAARGDELVALVSTWQAPLRDIQIHGFALLIILGVSQRLFHHFYGLPIANSRLSLSTLAVLNAAVAGEAAGLVLMKISSHAWAALWYGSVLALAAATAVLVKSWRIFSPAEDGDRSLKFLRAAYVWLFVSLAMLVALPAYQYGLLAAVAPESAAARLGFSHAYYGAARHAITVGFVSLMIVGVAAKVVPTLNGISPASLTALWPTFLLINCGCALRVCGQTVTDFSSHAYPLAGVSGTLEVTGLAIWGWHLWQVMSGKAGARAGATLHTTTPINGPIEPRHTVAAVLERFPDLLPIFVSFGFKMLADPHFRRGIARVVTIERACRRMGVDCQQFVAALNEARMARLQMIAADEVYVLPAMTPGAPVASLRHTRGHR